MHSPYLKTADVGQRYGGVSARTIYRNYIHYKNYQRAEQY